MKKGCNKQNKFGSFAVRYRASKMERNYDIFDRVRQLITHNDSDDEGSTPPNRRHLSRQEISVPNPATETHRGHVARGLSSLFRSPPAPQPAQQQPQGDRHRQLGPQFRVLVGSTTNRRRSRSRRTQRSGSRFLRTVVLLPGPRYSDVPRGRLREHMYDAGLEKRVQFSSGMTALETRHAILGAFQQNGHLTNTT